MKPRIPVELAPLRALATNLWWSWNEGARAWNRRRTTRLAVELLEDRCLLSSAGGLTPGYGNLPLIFEALARARAAFTTRLSSAAPRSARSKLPR